MYFVAIKMGRRQGARRARVQSIRNRRATPPPAHFHRNPPGRSQLAVFLRCSLDPYHQDMGLRSRLEKNSQLTPAKYMLFRGQDTTIGTPDPVAAPKPSLRVTPPRSSFQTRKPPVHLRAPERPS